MFTTNFLRHQKTCLYKNEIGATKSQIIAALNNQPHIEKENDRNELLDLAYLELKNFLNEVHSKSKYLQRKIVEDDLTDPIQKIQQMHVSEGTKYNYLVEYKLYQKWLAANKKLISPETANQYLASLKCRASTLKKKQMTLQYLLKFLVDPNIKLNPIRMRISYQPKYSLSETELDAYLEEQKEDPEMYLIQKIMVTYGLRVNTPAGLKFKHLLFMEEGDMILLPDTKVNSQRAERVPQKLMAELKDFVQGKDLEPEDYIFCRRKSQLSVRRRASLFSVFINKRINTSQVLKKNPNFKYSSHMFRKTKAHELFQQGLKELKERSRKAIGQASNSSAIEFYIN
jgi:hypothetical protein